MRLTPPVRLNNKLSRLSILALVGLVAFAAVVLFVNPFGTRPGVSAAVQGGASSPSGSAGQVGAGSPGSLLTTTPGSGSGSGGTHHHDDDGNFTGDS